MQRIEQRRRPRQVTFGLRGQRLFRKSIDVIRRDIENLIQLPQRLRKAAEKDIGERVLR